MRLTLLASATLFMTALGAEELVISDPLTAGISGLRKSWDSPIPLAEDGAAVAKETHDCGTALTAQWFDDQRSGKPGALVFDAVHRGMLVRFPAAAERIAAALKGGKTISKAELVLELKDVEFMPFGYGEPSGMSFMGSLWKDKAPRWHAVAWAVRKPWTADAAIGPTFNDAIKGAVSWKRFGAADEQEDRFPQQLGPAEVSTAQPTGRLDVTALLTDAAYGKDLASRLRAFSDQGVLVKKAEIYDMRYFQGGYEWGTATGPRGILVKTPKLVLTLSDGKAETVAIAAAVDVPAMAKAKAGQAKPTAVMPDEARIKALMEQYGTKKPAWMPDWQWQRTQELLAAGEEGRAHGFPTTVEAYQKWIDEQIGTPPRQWQGFNAASLLQSVYLYRDALPEPVVEHWKLYWRAWLSPEVAAKDLKHSWTQSKEIRDFYEQHPTEWKAFSDFYRPYCYNMGTMNFNHTAATGALLGGHLIGSKVVEADGRHGLEHWPLREWSWFDGTTQESIDHYYMAISIKDQKAFADFGPTQMDRMMGRSCLTKSTEELGSAFHPNLRRFISSGGRTSPPYLWGTQDGTAAVVHALSRKGAITDLGKKTTLGDMPVHGHDLPPDMVGLQAINGAWGPTWMADLIDDKPLPYAFTNSYKEWGGYGATPMWKRGWLGQWCGLASIDVGSGNQSIPFMAQWVREAKPATSAADLGTMTCKVGLNRTNLVDATWHGDLTKQHRNPNGSLDTWGGYPVTFQHLNRAIIAPKVLKDLNYEHYKAPAEVFSIQTTLGIQTWQDPSKLTFLVNGKPATLPIKAKAYDRIVIQDGVGLVGLIPLPSADLGRTDEVVISADEGPLEDLQAGGKGKMTLRIDQYLYKSDKSMTAEQRSAAATFTAHGGFAVTISDTSAAKDAATFAAQLAKQELKAEFDAKTVTNAISWKDGADLMECAIKTDYNGSWDTKTPTDKLFTKRTVNGQWAYNAPGIDRDTTLTQMSAAGKIEKNGAKLSGEPGNMLYLATLPKQGVWAAYNPFPVPVALTLEIPGGISITGDGKLGMLQLTVDTTANRITADYALHEAQAKNPIVAGCLVVSGWGAKAPTVTVNGKDLAADAVVSGQLDGKSVLIIPVADGAKPATALERMAGLNKARAAAAGIDPKQTLIGKWQLVAGYPTGGDVSKGFATAFPPEKGFDRNAQLGEKMEWHPVSLAGKNGFTDQQIDFTTNSTLKENAVGYAYAEVTSDADRDALLLAGSDDTLTIWVNGVQVHANEVLRGAAFDSDQVPVKLKKGANTILCKVVQGAGGWGLMVRLADNYGMPLRPAALSVTTP